MNTFTPSIGQTLLGTFFSGKNGIGYVRIPDYNNAIEIPSHLTHIALHQDKVMVRIDSFEHTTGALGTILSIEHRANYHYICTIAKRGDATIVAIPEDRYNSGKEFVIHPDNLNQATVGSRVALDINLWTQREFPQGRVVKVLSDDLDGIMQGLALQQGFQEEFPHEVLEMAHYLEQQGIPQSEQATRRDMRDDFTITIDPDNAKDFDDALSYRDNNDGTLTLGVHIADVSYYVQEHTPLDDEARKRATSVYLVDRTIPMLPEALSNNLCSLRPHEDRLTFSVVWKMTPQGDVLDVWYGRAIIHSNRRMTYEQAFDILSGKDSEEPYKTAVMAFHAIAQRYQQERYDNGALSLEKEELSFVLDESGTPISVRTKIRNDAHKMIEEWMLLANRYVAEYLSKKNATSFMVYRIHGQPDIERMSELATFLKGMGYQPHTDKGIISNKDLRSLVDQAPNHYERDVLSLAIARSMQKAIYSLENIGHYGLGFSHYTHFTSPIRRYPDLMVHRLLQKALDNVTLSREEYDDNQHMTAHSSERERNASYAERESENYMQAKYMEKHVGEVFSGMVTGVSRHGLFVSELETKCEGRASLRDIQGDYFVWDEEKKTIRGDKTKKTFKLGDSVTIKVLKVDIKNRQIDYAILDAPKRSV